uniref:INO80 complex subunit E N-terminal domain-containing protein n=1 Tax=Taeniopygia guttata TaxID=59729 RepID=A0A674H779_TAEGU
MGFAQRGPIRRRRGKGRANEERGEGRGLSAMNGASEGDGGGYKRRCRALKRRLKLLLYEQECFQEELRRAQRKLLKVSRDKSFLLDRLLQYENVDDDSSDSEATASSDNSDGDGAKGAEPTPAKRRRSPTPPPSNFGPSSYLMASPPYGSFPLPPQGGARPRPVPARRSKGTRRGQVRGGATERGGDKGKGGGA